MFTNIFKKKLASKLLEIEVGLDISASPSILYTQLTISATMGPIS